MAAELNTFKIYSFVLTKDDGSEVKNDDFYKHFNPYNDLEDEAVFVKLFQSFVDYFDKGFKVNSKGNRAVSIAKSKGLVQWNAPERQIFGFVKGGLTALDNMDKYDMSNNETPNGEINDTDVLSQHYFFWIWVPRNTNTGFIILQFNNSIVRGISQPFFQRIEEWFESCGFRFTKSGFVPDALQDAFLRDSNVVQVKGIKHIKSDEFSPLKGEVEMKNLSVHRIVSGLSFPFKDFISHHFGNRRPSDKLLSLLQLEDDDDLKLSVTCRRLKENKTYNLTSDNGVTPQISIDSILIDRKPDEGSVQKLYSEIQNKYLPLLKNFIQKTE